MKKINLFLVSVLIGLCVYQLWWSFHSPVHGQTSMPVTPVSDTPPLLIDKAPITSSAVVASTAVPITPPSNTSSVLIDIAPTEQATIVKDNITTVPVEEITVASATEPKVITIKEEDLVLAATVQSEAIPVVPIKKVPNYDKTIKPSNTKAYIPSQAFEYLDTIKQEQHRLMPDFAYPFYFAGLIEHESCISLTHKRCWSITSELKTKRERGSGLFQLTQAYNTDGSIRFDTLSDLRKRHMAELSELSWSNITQRADLQIRAGILLSKNNYQALYPIKDDYQRLAMADAAYNGGLAGLKKERTVCGLAANCDPQKWFDHVENQCQKSKKPLYAGRSACDINRHHVVDVLTTRMPKYKPFI